MLIAALGDSLLPAATIQDAAALYALGRPAANATDTDPGKHFAGRGRVIVSAGVNDKIDITAGTATLTAGTYNSVAEWLIEVVTQLNTVSATWTGYQLQGATGRGAIELTHSSGQALLINSGANAATNALRLLGGFRNQDRASGTTHAGDFAVKMGAFDSILYDLGSAKTIEFLAAVAPKCSPGAAVKVSVGSTTAVSDATYVLSSEAFDDEVLTHLVASPGQYRYLRYEIHDPRGAGAGWRVGAGILYAGPALDTDDTATHDPVEFDASGPRRALGLRHTVTDGKTGHPIAIDEVRPGESITVSFGAASPSLASRLRVMLDKLGGGGLAIVRLDADDHRSSHLCRVDVQAARRQLAQESKSGRYDLALTLEVVDVRGIEAP